MTTDHRETLRALLASYAREWPDETTVVARIAALVRERDDCLLRTCFEPGHITASAWVCSPDGERCVLLHHGKLDKWLQPGGHVDGEARPWLAAQREVEEETGLRELELFHRGGQLIPLDLDVHVIPARRGEPQHEHHDVRFLLRTRADAPLVLSEESNELRWIDTAHLGDFTREASVLRLAQKAQRWIASGGI